MKVTIDIDCTPEEARTFLGLPDVAPMQAALLDEMQKRMMKALEASDPEQLFATWMPGAMQGWEQVQKAFWSQMGAAGSSARSGGGKSGKDKD